MKSMQKFVIRLGKNHSSIKLNYIYIYIYAHLSNNGPIP